VSLPAGLAGSSGQAAAAAAELSPPYPELVSEFCKFLRAIAQEVRESGGHVIIGIDELDKISDGEQAQRFINELKAVLGVPNCYYLIAVSENALAAYDLRGLPIRDAFDSAFDEVIPLGYQSLDGSRDLLAKRVIGMSEPFACLCHCLAAGLPHDLIRTARHAVAASRRSGPRPDHLSTICERLVADELSRKLHATGIKWARSQPRKPESDILYSIQQITERQTAPGVLLKDLYSLLNNLAITARHIRGGDDASPISELAGYLYYLETLLEIFTNELTREQMVAVDTGHREATGAFDQLCFAKQTLAIDWRRSWLTVDAFRRAWDLAIIPLSQRGRRRINPAAVTPSSRPEDPAVS
jgi:hypothetical protein